MQLADQMVSASRLAVFDCGNLQDVLFLRWFIFNPKASISLKSKIVKCFSLFSKISVILEIGGLMDNMIGQRIKERRKELHITQTDIQDACGISSGNLSGIETGRYLPSAMSLIELARILNCSVDWILTGKSSISKNFDFVDIKEDSNERKLLDYYYKMSSEDQDELLIIAQIKADKRKRARDAKSSPSIEDNAFSDIA